MHVIKVRLRWIAQTVKINRIKQFIECILKSISVKDQTELGN